MAESELGVAVLRVVAKTDEAQAAIDALRQNIGRGFGDNRNFFASLEQSAKESVTRTGKILRDGAKGFRDIIDSTFKEKLSFGSVEAALDFKPGNTIKDLREYSRALQDLADKSQIGANSTQQLLDRIGAVDAAIRRSSQTTAQANDIQRQFNASLQAASRIRLKEQAAPITPASQRGTSEALQAAQASAPAVRRIRELLNSLTEPGPRFDVKNLQQIGAEAASAGVEISKFTRDILNGERALAVTRDGLRAQAQAYQTLAATVRIGTAEFTNYTQAAAKATQKEVFAGFDELKALRQLFDFGRAAGPKDGINLDSFRGSEELLKFASRVERTPAAINLYVQALEQAKSVTLTTSDNFQLLTAEIDRQRAALDAATRSAEAFSRIQQLTAEQRRQVGQAFIDASRAQAQLALPSSELLQQRVAQSGGSQPTRLQPGTTNLVNGEALRLAQQQLATDLQSLAAKNGIAAEQAEINSLLGLGKRLLESTVDVINEQAQGYKFQTEQLQDQLAIQQQLRTLEAQRSKDARSRLAAEQSTRDNVDNARQRRLQKQREDEFDRRLGAVLSRRQDQQEVRRRVGDATGSALIGGAFPLLFGQGLGASIGGGLGGLAGGALGGQFGFGLSLVGTALGAAFDTASEGAKTLAKALDYPISQFQALADASLLSSKGLEKQIASLISVGREAEAGALIQRDLISSYGSLDAAQENIKVTDELNRAWSRLTTGMIGFVNGPLKLLAERLENDFQRNRSVGIEQALRDAGLGGRADALRREAAVPIANSDTAQIAAINDRYASELPAVKAATAALESARRTRQQILDLQLRQTAASVRDNTVLQAGVELDLIRLREREKLQQLRADGKLFTETSPGVYELSPEAKRAQEEAASQRRQLAENAAASAERSARELRNARQLIGLEGERLTIKQEQQKVDEAQRLFAEADRTFRQKYSGTDPAKLVGAEKEAYNTLFNARLAAENNLTRVRLQSYEQIQRAEERIALSRQAVEDRITNARQGRSLTGLGRGVLDDISSFRQQILAAQSVISRGEANPYNADLVAQAEDAKRSLVAAGEELKNKLADSYQSAQDAVRAISRSIEDSVLALQQAQNQRGAGLNEFLSPQQVTDRQQQINQQLSGAANELIKQLRDQLGLNVQFRLTGTTEQRNAALGRFLTSGRQEVRAVQDIRRQEEDLRKAQADLATAAKSNDEFGKMIAQNRIDIASGRGDTASTMNALASSTVNQTVETKKLTDAIAALTSKPWDVVVNVAANGQASVYGDAVNGAF